MDVLIVFLYAMAIDAIITLLVWMKQPDADLSISAFFGDSVFDILCHVDCIILFALMISVIKADPGLRRLSLTCGAVLGWMLAKLFAEIYIGTKGFEIEMGKMDKIGINDIMGLNIGDVAAILWFTAFLVIASMLLYTVLMYIFVAYVCCLAICGLCYGFCCVPFIPYIGPAAMLLLFFLLATTESLKIGPHEGEMVNVMTLGKRTAILGALLVLHGDWIFPYIGNTVMLLLTVAGILVATNVSDLKYKGKKVIMTLGTQTAILGALLGINLVLYGDWVLWKMGWVEGFSNGGQFRERQGGRLEPFQFWFTVVAVFWVPLCAAFRLRFTAFRLRWVLERPAIVQNKTDLPPDTTLTDIDMQFRMALMAESSPALVLNAPAPP